MSSVLNILHDNTLKLNLKNSSQTQNIALDVVMESKIFINEVDKRNSEYVNTLGNSLQSYMTNLDAISWETM